jgi:hypothetical protein
LIRRSWRRKSTDGVWFSTLCSNEYGSLLGYVAFINNKIVPVMLDAHLDRELLSKLIEAYKPDYLWLPEAIKNEFGFTAVYESNGYALLKTLYTKEYPLYEELALLLTTSGSTGSPKLVRQSYRKYRQTPNPLYSILN